MADFIIGSLRGGVNNYDPSIAISDDQCTVAQNVELSRSMLGERRQGTDAIDLPASITAHDRVPFLCRHLPTADVTAAELWVLGVTGTASSTLARKTTSWSDVTVSDAATLTGFSQYQWNAVSFHGKLFVAYDSALDRLHVWDGTSLRRVGLAEPAAPTGANTGAGTFSGTRYYRVRYTVQAAGVTTRRSEPSDALTFAPSGTGTGVIVTKPAAISEGETHWELEASTDNVNFYVLATTLVATTTVTDSTAITTGYSAFTLSEDTGDYALIGSGKYLAADDDRLLIAGSWEAAALESRVSWTPVNGADGVGNDERLETDVDPFVDLDGYEGGPITGMASTSAGTVWVFKFNHIYKLVRSGLRTRSYDIVTITKSRGAIHGSVVAGLDQLGRPCVYFLDPAVGPCRAGSGGIMRCGADVNTSWNLKNLEATKVVCSSLYYGANKQVIWNFATGSSNVPDLSIVLHTNETRETDDGIRRGWVTWTGNRTKALTMSLYSSNIDDNTARNRTLVPFIGVEGLGLVHRCDTGNADNAVTYSARIVTKPHTLKTLLHKFGVMMGALLAKAVTGAKVDVKVIRDFALETTITISDVTFDAAGSETDVIKVLDNLKGAEMRVAQFEFVDPASAGTRFELNQLCLVERAEQNN